MRGQPACTLTYNGRHLSPLTTVLPFMSDLLALIESSSWSMLVIIFALLVLASGMGKYRSGRNASKDTSPDEGLSVVLGATLSLFGLLIGFLLSIAIGGYNTRVSAEENEAMAIGNALQRASLLATEQEQRQAEQMLQAYLNSRIQFYETPNEAGRVDLRLTSIQQQTKMWKFLSDAAKKDPTPVMMSLLDACNQLYISQQKTMASWREQIPLAAWVVLIVFGVFSNFLIGYDMNGRRRGLVLVVPFVTALALFMVAEIDVPGKGVIHVTADNLHSLSTLIVRGGLLP